MVGCAAFGCSNQSSKGFLMKAFPRDPRRRKIWTNQVRRKDWTPTDNTRLCEYQVHFAPEMWEQPRVDGKRILKCNAVPTIFNFNYKRATWRRPPKKIIVPPNIKEENVFEPQSSCSLGQQELHGIPEQFTPSSNLLSPSSLVESHSPLYLEKQHFQQIFCTPAKIEFSSPIKEENVVESQLSCSSAEKELHVPEQSTSSTNLLSLSSPVRSLSPQHLEKLHLQQRLLTPVKIELSSPIKEENVFESQLSCSSAEQELPIPEQDTSSTNLLSLSSPVGSVSPLDLEKHQILLTPVKIELSSPIKEENVFEPQSYCFPAEQALHIPEQSTSATSLPSLSSPV